MRNRPYPARPRASCTKKTTENRRQMNKRVRGAASLSPSRDATHEAQNPASRIWSGAHPGRKRSVRKTCGATKSSGVRMAIVPKKAAVRMSALFLPRTYHASPVFPSSNRAAVAVNSDTPSRMHASRIHGCSMNMRICTNCAAAHTQRAANSGNNTSVTCRIHASRLQTSSANSIQPTENGYCPARQKCAPPNTKASEDGVRHKIERMMLTDGSFQAEYPILSDAA